MSYRAKNNSFGQLASGLSAGATSMTLQAGQGDRFPVIANPDYTFVTLEDAAGNREIVKVTARNAASDVMTIVRAQEGTVARGWSAGDVVELRMTASLVETAMAHPAQTTGAHAASAISVTPTGSLASTNVQAALAELDNEKADDFDVLEINRGGSGADTRHGALAAFGVEASEATILTLINATTDIGAAAANNILLTTGATSITGFAAAAAGVWRKVRMATGGVTLVHSTTFVLPGASDIVTAANDCFEAFYTGSAWIVRNYQKADGSPLRSGFGGSVTVSSPYNDWNNAANTKPGPCPNLLLGSDPNGPGMAEYFYVLVFEYSTKNGSGNLVQRAIPYSIQSSNATCYMRTRYGGVWSAWIPDISYSKIVNTLGYTPANPADAATDHNHNSIYVSVNMTHGAIGSLCFASGNVTTTAGNTAAGANLAPVGIAFSDPEGYGTAASQDRGSALTGTWRCLGNSNYASGTRYLPATLWQRIL